MRIARRLTPLIGSYKSRLQAYVFVLVYGSPRRTSRNRGERYPVSDVNNPRNPLTLRLNPIGQKHAATHITENAPQNNIRNEVMDLQYVWIFKFPFHTFG